VTYYQGFCPLHEWDWNYCQPECKESKAELWRINCDLASYWRSLKGRRVQQMLRRHVLKVA
jgi:hypothetical protein